MAPVDLQPGDRVERYEVEALLGEGGMARVYRVRHTTLGTVHALKVLTLTSASLQERLVGEGRAQARLDHPNVVRVNDVIDVNGLPGLVMEYVEGPELGRWIQLTKPDPEAAEEVFRGIVAGMQAAHDEGLVHRDLKPGNVLMARVGDGRFVPRVTDFGLAKVIAGDEPEKWKTRTGLPMGTPQYMSPEQIRDASNVDRRADLYSLGCILYELLAHRPCYDGDDAITIFNKVLEGERAPLDELVRGVSSRLVTAVEACLVGDRDLRIGDCRALLRLLDGGDGVTDIPAARQEELRKAPPGPPPVLVDALSDVRGQIPTLPPARRRLLMFGLPVVVGGGAGLILLALAVAWITGGQAEPEEPVDEAVAEEEAPLDEAPRGQGVPCPTEGGRIGWTQVHQSPLLFRRKVGQEHTLPRAQNVRDQVPGEGNGWQLGEVVCTLPAGSVVVLREDAVKAGRGNPWIAVYGGSWRAGP